MAALEMSLVSRMAQVFNPKEDGWSESVNIIFTEDIDGYKVNPTSKLKEHGKTNHVSVFIGDVIKALCAGDANVAAFLSAKTHDEKVILVPMLLANAAVKLTREHDDKEKEYITDVLEINVPESIMARINKALDDVFAL